MDPASRAMIRSMLSAVVPGRQTTAVLGVLLAGVPQGTPPRYTEQMLACAAFREEVRSDIRNEAGTIVRDERAGRDGVLLVQAARGDESLALTAWYDSLLVYREGPEGRTAPDAEGLLGGRWRGTLTSSGRYRGIESPFIPDEVAEIADLRGVMGDFFPVFEEHPGREVTVRRTGEVAGGLARYAWTIKFRADTSGAVDDTLVVPMGRQFQENGTMTWDPLRGPIRWERTISVTGRIEAKGPIRRGMRSTVIQRVRVERIENRPCA
jgi:hypothetical protein